MTRTDQSSSQSGARRYGFFSRTTLDFTLIRIRHDGLRSALTGLRQDFLYSVVRRRPMYDHRIEQWAGVEQLEPEPEVCPTCGDSGEVHRVLTPKLDHRDPAFDYETFDCPDCGDINAL